MKEVNDVSVENKIVNNANDNLNSGKNQNLENYKFIVDMFGPEGKIHEGAGDGHFKEYNDIQIDVPDGLSKELVSAIVLGSCLDKKRMLDKLTDTYTGGELEIHNEKHLMNCVLKGETLGEGFAPLMAEARKDAKRAIEAYKNGDASQIKNLLQKVVNYSVFNVSDYGLENSSDDKNISNDKLFFKFCQDIVIDNDLKINPKSGKGKTYITAARMANYSKQIDAYNNASDMKKTLIDSADNGQFDMKAKGELAEEIILNSFIAAMADKELKDRKNKAEEFQKKTFNGLGIKYDDALREELKDQTKQINLVYNMFSISDHEAILSKKDGKEQLKALYSDAIKKSDIYKNIINAQNKNEMIESLKAVDKAALQGFGSFTEVKVPNASAELNNKYSEHLKSELALDKSKTLYKAFGSEEGRLSEDVKKYGFKTTDPADVRKHAKMIDDLYNLVKKNNYRGGSKNNHYKDTLDSLKKLRDYMAKLSKKEEGMGPTEVSNYTNMVSDLDKLADKYLTNKTNINGGYARDRVAGIKLMRRRLLATSPSIDAAIIVKKQELNNSIFGEKYKLFDEINPLGPHKPFFNDKYKNEEFRKVGEGNSFTLARLGGISIATLAMAATGKYSFEDLMDPTKCLKDKQEMFDKVAKAIKRHDLPENRKWIAEQIYFGRKATNKILEEQTKKIDFNKVDIYHDKNFIMYLHLNKLRFDSEQEMNRVKNEFVEVAKKDDPSFKSYDDVKVFISPMFTVSAALDKQKDYVIKLATCDEMTADNASNVIGYQISIKNALNRMEEFKKKNEGVPIEKWMTAENHLEFNNDIQSLAEPIKTQVLYMNNNPKLAKDLIDDMLDGKITKNAFSHEKTVVLNQAEISKNPTAVPITGKVIEVSGLPNKQVMLIEAENAKFLKKANEAVQRLSTKKYYVKDKKQYFEDAAYALIGGMHRASGWKMPVDFKTEKIISLEDYKNKMVKDPDFQQSLLNREADKIKYYSPAAIADYSKNEVKMKEYINKMINPVKKTLLADPAEKLEADSKKKIKKTANKKTSSTAKKKVNDEKIKKS